MTRDLVNLFIGLFIGQASVILAFKIGAIVGKLFGA